jgi:hypothetical protein
MNELINEQTLRLPDRLANMQTETLVNKNVAIAVLKPI